MKNDINKTVLDILPEKDYNFQAKYLYPQTQEENYIHSIIKIQMYAKELDRQNRIKDTEIEEKLELLINKREEILKIKRQGIKQDGS